MKTRVRRHGGKPLRNGRVSIAGAGARTNGRGVAVLRAQLERAGRFKVIARKRGRWGASGYVQLGEPEAAPRRAPANGAA